MTAPDGPCHLQLKVIQDAGGTNTLTITGVLWPSGTAPTFTADGNAVDIVSLWYDGTNYYGTILQDFG